MKIVYILKKGFQLFPPCLAQLLYLDDMGIELEVYHGNNSDAINAILDKRGIKHYTLKSDRVNTNKLQSFKTLFDYTCEIKKILKKIPKDTTLWFGNCESCVTVGKMIYDRKFVLSVLELDDTDSLIGKQLKKVINKAAVVLCCEKHRAAIMRIYYNLEREPYVLPNKPYEFSDDADIKLDEKYQSIVEPIKDKFIVLYQGIISSDRPLDKIADALALLNDEDTYFLVLGKADEAYREELKKHYPRTVFGGFIPSPQHLLVTQYAKIGIANYDYSCLNNLFCAPNKIYEYAKFGMPMLTSTNLGLTETVGAANAAVCVDFLDVKQIAEGINKIKSNYELYSKSAIDFNEGTSNFETIKEIVKEL